MALRKVLGAPGDGVLIDVGSNRVLRRPLDLRRSRKIREALRQIDGAMHHGLARHLANHRFSEVRDFVAKKRFRVDGVFCHEASLAQSATSGSDDGLCGDGSSTRPAERSSAAQGRNAWRAALAPAGSETRPHTGITDC